MQVHTGLLSFVYVANAGLTVFIRNSNASNVFSELRTQLSVACTSCLQYDQLGRSSGLRYAKST